MHSLQVAYYVACIIFITLPSGCAQSSRTPDATGRSQPASAADSLKICPGMRVSNAPPHISGQISPFYPFIVVQGVELMTAPVRNACLSSGFGPRGNRLHKGVDYHQRPGGSIYAAGAGTVLELHFRKDYGNMILIDHGRGVYTRYAHLKNFTGRIDKGSVVRRGALLGTMGKTGRTKAVHLHYEILLGNYNNPANSFGLKPVSPFKSALK